MFNWKNVFRGAAMGITELVPGVSASTIAMLLGIYEKLLQAISDLTTGHIKRAFRFLIPLGIGMVAAVALFVKLIEYLLHVHNQPMMFLFAGLVLGILPFLWRSAHAETKHSFKPLHYVLMIGAFVLIAMTNFVGESNQAVMENLSLPDYVYLFFQAGWQALPLCCPVLVVRSFFDSWRVPHSDCFPLDHEYPCYYRNWLWRCPWAACDKPARPFLS